MKEYYCVHRTSYGYEMRSLNEETFSVKVCREFKDKYLKEWTPLPTFEPRVMSEEEKEFERHIDDEMQCDQLKLYDH